jgi:peptidyl-prolyl cis-trans isomerase C
MVPSIAIRARRLAVVLAALVVAVTAVGYVVVGKHDTLPKDAALKVGGAVISIDDVDSRMKALQALYGVEKPTDPKKLDTFRRDTAKSMAVQRLMEAAASTKGIVIADKAVRDSVAALIEQRYPDGGHTAFVSALGELGASEEQVRDEIAQQMMVARLFGDVTSNVSVSVGEVRAAFADRRSDLGTKAQRSLRNIVVASRSDALRVMRAIRSGASFAAVARRSSLDAATRNKGGKLGTMPASQLDPGYAAAAFAAAVGQPFGPVHTKFGWNVGLVERVVAARPATFGSVAAKLKTTLQQEKSVAVWTTWLEHLIATGDVVYADSYRPADPDGVPPLGGSTPSDQGR